MIYLKEGKQDVNRKSMRRWNKETRKIGSQIIIIHFNFSIQSCLPVPCLWLPSSFSSQEINDSNPSTLAFLSRYSQTTLKVHDFNLFPSIPTPYSLSLSLSFCMRILSFRCFFSSWKFAISIEKTVRTTYKRTPWGKGGTTLSHSGRLAMLYADQRRIKRNETDQQTRR